MAKLAAPLVALVVILGEPVLAYLLEVKAPWIFLTGALAIGVLADRVRRSTEHLTARVGPAIDGLLDVNSGFLGLGLAVMVGSIDRLSWLERRRKGSRVNLGGPPWGGTRC